MEQKLGGIRDVDLRDAVLVVAQAALEETLLKLTMGGVSVCCSRERKEERNLRNGRHQATVIANVNAERIRDVE